jgi:hypothetical protein
VTQMPSDVIPFSLARHPAQHRARVSIWVVLYSVFASGIFWAGHLILNFALAVHACYPGRIPLARVDSGAGWAWPLILGLDIATLLLIGSTFLTSYRIWQRSGTEAEGHHHHLMEKGEGRTRFLGIVGMAFAVMFFLITMTDTITLAMVPICAQ